MLISHESTAYNSRYSSSSEIGAPRPSYGTAGRGSVARAHWHHLVRTRRRSSPFDALVEAFPYFGTSTTALGDLSRAIAVLGKRSGIFLSPEVAADCRAVDTSMAGFWIPAPIHGDRAGIPAVPQATDHSVKTVDSSPTVRCPKHYAALPTVVPHRAFRENT